uniref:U-box domain-containing protein n=1 Tax=Aureoumbra lagunensis TaxID=44058 RepID=A0A7S3K2U5_9STRA|mmetsp:Transcript_16752/g.21775  ORF Transcript_16752/g.21775 Transcript_16752/m.21775 type:complete len:666 (-) Transcript_16752:247-2244(-)
MSYKYAVPESCVESVELFVNEKSEALLEEAGSKAICLFAASCRSHFGEEAWLVESGKLWRKCIKSASKKKRSAVSRAEESDDVFANELIKVARRFGIDENEFIETRRIDPQSHTEEYQEKNMLLAVDTIYEPVLEEKSEGDNVITPSEKFSPDRLRNKDEENDLRDDKNENISIASSEISEGGVNEDDLELHKVSESSISTGEDTIDALQVQVRLMRRHLRHQAKINQAREAEIRKLRLQNYARCRKNAHTEAICIQTIWRTVYNYKKFSSLRLAQITIAKYRRGIIRRRAFLALALIRANIAARKLLHLFKVFALRVQAVRTIQRCGRIAIATHNDRFKKRTRRAWYLDQKIKNVTQEAYTKCPLSGKLLTKDPLICLADGRAYDAKALREYIDKYGVVPSSDNVCTSNDLASRTKLRGIVNKYYSLKDVAIEACEAACDALNFSCLKSLFACCAVDTVKHFLIKLADLLKNDNISFAADASTAMIQAQIPVLIIHHLGLGLKLLALHASLVLELLAQTHPNDILAIDPTPILMKAFMAAHGIAAKKQVASTLGILSHHSNQVYDFIANAKLMPADRKLLRNFLSDDSSNGNTTGGDDEASPPNSDDGNIIPTSSLKKPNQTPRTNKNKSKKNHRRHRKESTTTTPLESHLSPACSTTPSPPTT